MTRRASSLVMAALLLQAPVSWAAQLDKDACTKLKSEQVQLERDGARDSLGRGPDWAKANLAPDKIEQVRRLIAVDEQLLFRCGGRPLVVLPSDPDAAPGEGAPGKPAPRPPGTATETRPPVSGKKAAVPARKPIAQPGKETVREARPTAPLPGGNAAAVGGAKEAAKEAPPAGSPPAAEAASPPAPAPAKQDPASVVPATAVLPSAAAPPATQAEEEKKAAAPKAAKAKAKKKAEDAYRPPAPDWNSNPFADQTAPPAKR